MSLFDEIREVVKHIPEGKVMTYGDVAKAVETKDSRKVGWALHGNKDPEIPCHRVLKKDGLLAKSYSIGGWDWQKKLLQDEGVEFVDEYQVDMDQYHWQP